MKWRGIALACIALLVACGGGEESNVDTTPAKQAVLEATTTAAPTMAAPTTIDEPPLCAENEARVATALASMDRQPATPTDLADTLHAAGDYAVWLADELPPMHRPAAAYLAAVSIGAAEAFDGKDDVNAAIPDMAIHGEEILSEYGSEFPSGDVYAIDDFFLVCDQVDIESSEVFKAADEAVLLLTSVSGFAFSLFGFDDEELDGYDNYGEGGDEGDLPDAPEGFCAGLEGQVADLRADLMFAEDDIDGEAELEAFVYTAMVPLDDWLVENVPAELTADAEVVQSFFAALSARFAEATTEDDFYAALAEPPGDVWALDQAGLRLDAFLDQSCGMTMSPDGAFGLADELVYDDYDEDDAPPLTTVPAKQTVLTTTTAP